MPLEMLEGFLARYLRADMEAVTLDGAPAIQLTLSFRSHIICRSTVALPGPQTAADPMAKHNADFDRIRSQWGQPRKETS